MRTVEINREPVELYKILKFEGLTTTGGEARGPNENHIWHVLNYGATVRLAS